MAPRALFTVAPPNSPWETTAGASNSPALASASELDPKNLCNPAAFQGYNGYKVLLTAGSATKQNIAKLEIIICQLQNVKTPQTLLAETI